MNKLVRVASILMLCASIAPSVMADESSGQKLFQSKCGGCHTVGKGALVGPDLASTRDWKVDDLTAAVKLMEKMAGPLSDSERADIVKYLKNQSPTATPAVSIDADKKVAGPEGTTPVESAAEAPKKTVAQGDAARGEMLFTGKKAFANGGMSCVACHSTSGQGTLGPDLKNISDKMNETALTAACEAAPFKVMKAAYAKHPIKKDEAADVASYLVSLKNKPQQKEFPLIPYGLAGSALVMITVAIAYRRRNTNVRDKLHRR